MTAHPAFPEPAPESAAGTGASGAAGAAGNTTAGEGPGQPVAAGASRFGISVKKALGGAVVRNRIRRRIREILRRNQTEIPQGWDMVIHPRSSVARAEFAPLEAELLRLLRSLPKSFPNPAPKAGA